MKQQQLQPGMGGEEHTQKSVTAFVQNWGSGSTLGPPWETPPTASVERRSAPLNSKHKVKEQWWYEECFDPFHFPTWPWVPPCRASLFASPGTVRDFSHRLRAHSPAWVQVLTETWPETRPAVMFPASALVCLDQGPHGWVGSLLGEVLCKVTETRSQQQAYDNNNVNLLLCQLRWGGGLL